jgi:hypothetical protein
MTGNELGSKRRQISLHDVQVGATNAASHHAKQNTSGGKLGTRNILDLKERSGRCRF